jgi:tetrapyrrole methylase family protein/MazG family protein
MVETSPTHPSLDRIAGLLGLAPHQVQAFDPAYPDFDAQRPLLVLAPHLEAARPVTRRRYPPATPARALLDSTVEEVSAATLPLEAEAWLLPALPAEDDRRALKGLRLTMERLFGPDGCPWDREQTHETLRAFLLEETYELVDAIDRGDMPGLREEVGDVLAHMFMQTAIAQQAGSFTLEDAVEYATEKFVRRHPHVFGDEEAESAEALLGKWEQIKAQERADRAEETEDIPEGALDSTPAAAPSLQRTQALIRRARRAGLADPAEAPRDALARAIEASAWEEALFALARLAGDAEIDAEETLRQAASQFTRAFRALEAEARAGGVEIEALPAARHASVWTSVSEDTPRGP